MKILFTGASSFTGYWFIKELLQKGHDVVAVFRQKEENYSGTREKRVKELRAQVPCEFECEFGSDKFLSLIKHYHGFDLFCHHAADVKDYKSPDFDVMSAVSNNTNNLFAVLQHLQSKGCEKVILTGSVFEQNEEHQAMSPYGLSKGLTSEIFRYYAAQLKIALYKFVIANPFGPFEELRFTSYLVNAWKKGEIPNVSTPDYIRDNIHVDLLAKAYVAFIEKSDEKKDVMVFRPSFYVESQGAFAKRFAHEIGQRLSFPCPLVLREQKDFSEPMQRVNNDLLAPKEYNWSEKRAWDELAAYYQNH